MVTAKFKAFRCKCERFIPVIQRPPKQRTVRSNLACGSNKKTQKSNSRENEGLWGGAALILRSYHPKAPIKKDSPRLSLCARSWAVCRPAAH